MRGRVELRPELVGLQRVARRLEAVGRVRERVAVDAGLTVGANVAGPKPAHTGIFGVMRVGQVDVLRSLEGVVVDASTAVAWTLAVAVPALAKTRASARMRDLIRGI